jgi:transporter family protein
VVVVFFAWLMVFVVGSFKAIIFIEAKTLIFLVLSGLATGGSWLCYFRALQIGDVNKVVPVDKSSTVLTILLAFIFLGEGISLLKVVAMVFIGAGTYLMIERKKEPGLAAVAANGYRWLVYAVMAAVFASLTAILGKIGIADIEANLGTAIRTAVVLLMAWLIVFVQGERREIEKIDKRSWVFIVLSGLATGLSWLCFYRALKEGPASVVVPVDKLSILVTVAFGYIVLREKLSRKAVLGLLMIVGGTLGLLIVG